MELYRDTEDSRSCPRTWSRSQHRGDRRDDGDADDRGADRRPSRPTWRSSTSCPMHIWESVEDPDEFGNDEMIGSGPFSLVEADQGESVELAANTEHWGTPPNIDGVIFQTYEADDARMTALTTSQIDAMLDVPETAIPALQNEENVVVNIAEVAAGGSFTRHLLQRHRGRGLPAGRRRLLRASGAEGPRRSAGARPRHRQGAADHGGNQRDRIARPVAGAAGPRRLLRVRDPGLRVRHRRGQRASSTRPATRTATATAFANACPTRTARTSPSASTTRLTRRPERASRRSSRRRGSRSAWRSPSRSSTRMR